jgi:O-succinylbenzoic acid--CoA ligase
MNYHIYNSIRINGEFFQEKLLKDHCLIKISEDTLPLWEKNLYNFILEWIFDDPFIKVKTSGSTGNPKWIRIEKDKMIQSALMTGRFFDLKKSDKALLCLPVDFIAGKMMVVRSIILGLNLILIEPAGYPLKNTAESFDFAAMTPLQVSNILSEKAGTEKLNRIGKLIIGGADIHPELLNEIKSLRNETWQTYGMTETITHVAVRKLNSSGETEFYQALPGVKFDQDERNCLIIQAPQLCETKVITNDIVELKNEREFKFIGRYDNIINTGGIKLSPEEIEAKLFPFIHHRFIVAGLPDIKLGQKLVLIIESREWEDIDLKKLAERSNLRKFEIPKQVFFLAPFSLTENGKINRKDVVKITTHP